MPAGVVEHEGSGVVPSRWEDLTDDVMLHVFRILAVDHEPEAQAANPASAGRGFMWFRRCLPLVCKRWSALLGRGGKYIWTSVVVSVEQEVARRRRPEAGSSASGPSAVAFSLAGGSGTCAGVNGGAGGGGVLSPVPGASGGVGLGGGSSGPAGSSPPAPSGFPLYMRPSLGPPLATLRGGNVVAWVDGRGACIGAGMALLLDFGSAAHDLGAGGHSLEALLRAANRGPRGLRALRINGSAGVGGQDSYEVLSRLRGLEELAVTGLPQGFLAGTLPYLSPLTALTRLSFTPEAFQFPVSVATLPRNLRYLSLSQLWISRLPDIGSAAPQLSELCLLRCCLVEGALAGLAGAAQLVALRLDGSSLTATPASGRLAWEESRCWPPLPGLAALSLAGCSLGGLPAGVLAAFPGLKLMDLSNNPDLGGGASVQDFAAAAACLPAELVGLTALAEVRLAGCGLTAVPAALLRVPTITALDLSSNSLSSLPLPAPLPPPSSLSNFGAWSAVAPGIGGGGGGAGTSAYGSSAKQQQQPWGAPWPSSSASALLNGGTVSASAPVAVVAAFAAGLVRLNIAMNRFTVWPQGLHACLNLRELVLGAPLVARAAEGELERCVAALLLRPQQPAAMAATGGVSRSSSSSDCGGRLERLEVRGAAFDPRAVRSLLAVQRMAAAAGGRLVVEVTGV